MLQQINSLTATVGAPLAQSSRADTIGLTNNPTIPVVESSSGISAANVSCVRHNPMHGDASHAMHLSPPGISASTLTSVSAPPEIASLTSQDFPYPSSRIKGNFYSAPEDTLMAHRLFPVRHPRNGTSFSSHSFALFLFARLRDRLQVCSALITAISTGRLGARGASVRWFMEKQRNISLTTASDNTVVTLNFSAGVELPAASCPPCTSMVDLVQAVAGLCNFADTFWYDHARHLASALQRFVNARMTADRSPPSPILRLTLNYVDLWLGNALEALASESPHWWSAYRSAVSAISADSPQWIADLVTETNRYRDDQDKLRQHQPQPAPGISRPDLRNALCPATGQTRQQQQQRPTLATKLPANLAHLLPRNDHNQMPCLRHFSGNGCPGGEQQCNLPNCVHTWPTALHTDLLAWAKNNVGVPRATRPRPRGRNQNN
ncbi:hypothetical protein PF008_g22548 [Phytophthora fragariae]|uniref:Uncharacterized protein n=1 Tax=Phytophthora fragariae TaxID=53985 RepID=A0A6G0QUG4_9STRA|nr:hypothetical protein PF008_g22548 [Phytophthora fragariae]